MLYSYGVLVPVFTMTIIEVLRAKLRVPETIATSQKPFLRWMVPVPLQALYIMVGVFCIGAATSQLLTDIAKYTIGRLRPHFFDLCQPRDLQKLCATPYTYVESFMCNSNATEHELKEMRLSFMSGHSSFSSYTMLYTVLYLQARVPWRNSLAVAARTVIQVALLCLAWYTALSRVSDYKHHWSDVLAGAASGYLVAIVVPARPEKRNAPSSGGSDWCRPVGTQESARNIWQSQIFENATRFARRAVSGRCEAWGIAPLFHPYGRLLMSAGSDTTVKLTLQPEQPLHLKSRFHDVGVP
ncbi:hypothetical protein HPB48_025331 [Haemaphysalis longicornis]|uniref:Phosphatidic acid phosphatase type 2/haloperoxidase domain-containing protein n=1 Tax=Haemaphysalis longicornis TaxID=44386 RepID=A0A9J6H7E8_HAELO|nr:hypothetical protein HPB48_025331 [Haemaphysalis longicornis]